MKVLYITHQLAFNIYGGAEVQMLKTIENIRSLDEDIEIKLFENEYDKIEDYDIIHIFAPKAFPLESFMIAKYAKENNIKVVTSPIFYENNKILKEIMNIKIPFIFFEYLIKFRNFISRIKYFQSLDPYYNMGKTLEISDFILPNTNEEMDFLLNRFPNLKKSKFVKIPNAVSTDFKFGKTDIFPKKYGINDFILFVGRIEIRKNVLTLIKAFVETDLKTNLVILGKVSNREYYDLCKKIADERVIFIPNVANNSEILKSAYKSAKVLVLPSYLETPGLAALEGGLAGANVVITEIGGTKEYFGDYAWYINPEKKESIKEAIISAYTSPKTKKLSNHIEKNFNWSDVAKMTLKIYKSLDI